MKAYWEFSNEMGIKHFPPTPEEVVLYSSWLLFTKCSKTASLLQYLSALRVYCSSLNLWVPSPTEFGPLRCLVEGSRRFFPGPTRRSQPVTAKMLASLIDTRPPRQATWRQLTTLQVLKDTCLLLWFTMLRSSNLFPAFPAAVDPVRQLTWDKIRLAPGGVIISILLSKTEQFREKIHEISLVAKPGSRFCPVAALNRLRVVRGAGVARPSDLVLQLPVTDNTWRPLVKYEFASWFHKRVIRMKLDPALFLLHGFRHGSIAWALLHQNNVTLVQLQSGHMSECIFVYSQIEPERRQLVATAMLDALDGL